MQTVGRARESCQPEPVVEEVPSSPRAPGSQPVWRVERVLAGLPRNLVRAERNLSETWKLVTSDGLWESPQGRFHVHLNLDAPTRQGWGPRGLTAGSLPLSDSALTRMHRNTASWPDKPTPRPAATCTADSDVTAGSQPRIGALKTHNLPAENSREERMHD